jgi:hypothetical protein
MSEGEPSNVTIDPSTKYFVVTPFTIEALIPRLTKGVVSKEFLTGLAPSHTDIILKTVPDLGSDHIVCPIFVSKAHCISFKPEFPKSEPSQKGLDGGESTKPSWNSLSEDIVVPIKVEMHRGIT